MKRVSGVIGLCTVAIALVIAGKARPLLIRGRPPVPAMDSLRLTLNIPALRLDVYEGSTRVATYAVAVGRPKYATPRGRFTVTSVEWNPWWIPPPSEWAKTERVTRPGWNNPMGRVKLQFMPYHFLHGTPLVASIGHAQSHGCVRMANADAIALARLVQRHGAPGITDDEVTRLLSDTSKTRHVDLATPVPLEVQYDVAEVRDGELLLHPDIYGLVGRAKRARAMAALLGAGRDTLGVSDSLLDDAVARSRRQVIHLPLDALTRR